MLWERAIDPAAWLDANCEIVDWVPPEHRWMLNLEAGDEKMDAALQKLRREKS